MEHIGERIKIIRKMYNIKQKEFAERVSVSASYISKVESGKEVPTDIVQAYSHFVSLVTMPGLNNDNQSRYLEALHGVIDILEQITYSSYMLKSVSDNNYKALLQHKTKVDTGISKIDDDIKKALSCYLTQYGKDLTL